MYMVAFYKEMAKKNVLTMTDNSLLKKSKDKYKTHIEDSKMCYQTPFK